MPAAAAPPTPGAEYIDLEPGWRLRVVTPILKSGGYRVRTVERPADDPGDHREIDPARDQGLTTTLSISDDFLGFEVAYYAVAARWGGGVRVAFTSAEVTKAGKMTPQPKPLTPLFLLGRGARHVRLIYLVRASRADHDMAVVAASREDSLAAMTHQVQADPAACASERRYSCSWIPAGIAVTPEKRITVAGAESWVPAR